MRRGLKVLGCLLLATPLFVLGSRAVARHYLFPAQGLRVVAPPTGFVEHRLIARDGVPVRVLELPAAKGASVVVHFHNNREIVENNVGIANELAARGLGVLLVEYRGYGQSTEAPSSEEGLYADAEAALDLLAARGVRPERIVLWGTSLGTGVAAEMARRGRGGRLVLMTPYTSIPDLVTNVVPFLPASLLVADHFDTLAKARAIAVPTIVVHGDADEIVPFQMGERVAAAIPGASLLRIHGGHHGDLLQRERARILDAISGASTSPAS